MAKMTKSETRKKIESHIGHKIQYFSDGHKGNYGVMQKTTIGNITGFIEIWLEGSPFPEKIFQDQIINCECLENK